MGPRIPRTSAAFKTDELRKRATIEDPKSAHNREKNRHGARAKVLGAVPMLVICDLYTSSTRPMHSAAMLKVEVKRRKDPQPGQKQYD